MVEHRWTRRPHDWDRGTLWVADSRARLSTAERAGRTVGTVANALGDQQSRTANLEERAVEARSL